MNPGSILRLTADQIDHKPKVYLWYEETNTVEPIYLPIEKDMITREHIVLKKEKDERIQKFIDRLNDDWKPHISLEENLKQAFDSNNTPDSIRQIIWDSIEGEIK